MVLANDDPSHKRLNPVTPDHDIRRVCRPVRESKEQFPVLGAFGDPCEPFVEVGQVRWDELD
jgi:hypothetical protein